MENESYASGLKKVYNAQDEGFEEELERFDQECDAALLRLSEKKNSESALPQDTYSKNNPV